MADENASAPTGFPPGLRIRAAQMEDTAQISVILAQAFPALYTWTFGRLSTEQTADMLRALYRAGTLTLATTLVAEKEDTDDQEEDTEPAREAADKGNKGDKKAVALQRRIVGVAILHVGESIGRGTMWAYWKVARSQLSLARAVRAFAGGVFANFAINKRIPRGEDLVYIEALAVTALSRGRGIGARLLSEAAAWGAARNRPRMALHVLQSNTRARRLYERTGFRLTHPEPRPAPTGSRRQGWVSLLMTRDPASFPNTPARPR